MTKKNKGLFKASGCGCGVSVVPEKEDKKEMLKKKVTINKKK